jgi:hypothetical protein
VAPHRVARLAILGLETTAYRAQSRPNAGNGQLTVRRGRPLQLRRPDERTHRRPYGRRRWRRWPAARDAARQGRSGRRVRNRGVDATDQEPDRSDCSLLRRSRNISAKVEIPRLNSLPTATMQTAKVRDGGQWQKSLATRQYYPRMLRSKVKYLRPCHQRCGGC